MDTQNLCLITKLTIKPETVNCYTVALKHKLTSIPIYTPGVNIPIEAFASLLYSHPEFNKFSLKAIIHNYFCFPSQQAKLQMYAAHYFY